jgi:hypothetical protein
MVGLQMSAILLVHVTKPHKFLGRVSDICRMSDLLYPILFLQKKITDFLTGAASFSFKYLLIYAHEAEWTPFLTNCYGENLVAPRIKSRTSWLAARNSDH